MAQKVKFEDRQMALNFNASPAAVEKAVASKSNVVNLRSFAYSKQPSVHPTPVLERLLKEAENLRW